MSSAFRITQRSLSHSTLAGLQANLARLQATQARLSSGRAIGRPSDSPTGTMAALRLRADLDRYTQLDRNADDGKARLGTADNALTDGLAILREARDAVLLGANASLSAQRPGSAGRAGGRAARQPAGRGQHEVPPAADLRRDGRRRPPPTTPPAPTRATPGR